MSLPLLLALLTVSGAGSETTSPHAPAPPGTASAEDAARKQAKELVAEAQKLYAKKRFAEAAARFERAYALRSVPAILFNLARCYDSMMDTPKALRAYRDYLRAAPGASDVAEVQASVVALEKRLRSLGLSQLLVLSDPPGARVRVDGKELGETPASVELVTGKYTVSLRLDGHAPEERMVAVTLEDSPVLSVLLKKLPPDAPRAEQPRPPPQRDAPSILQGPISPPPIIQLVDAPPGANQAQAPAEAVAVTQPTSEAPRRTATWVAAGTTAAVLLAGAGCLALAQWDAYQLVNDTTFDVDRRNSLYSSARSLDAVYPYVFMGAAVPAVATGVLFLLGK